MPHGTHPVQENWRCLLWVHLLRESSLWRNTYRDHSLKEKKILLSKLIQVTMFFHCFHYQPWISNHFQFERVILTVVLWNKKCLYLCILNQHALKTWTCHSFPEGRPINRTFYTCLTFLRLLKSCPIFSVCDKSKKKKYLSNNLLCKDGSIIESPKSSALGKFPPGAIMFSV